MPEITENDVRRFIGFLADFAEKARQYTEEWQNEENEKFKEYEEKKSKEKSICDCCIHTDRNDCKQSPFCRIVTVTYCPDWELTTPRERKDAQEREIVVGDEVRIGKAIEVVTRIRGLFVDTIDCDGNATTWDKRKYPLRTWEKTGRHFPIAELLERMGKKDG